MIVCSLKDDKIRRLYYPTLKSYSPILAHPKAQDECGYSIPLRQSAPTYITRTATIPAYGAFNRAAKFQLRK